MDPNFWPGAVRDLALLVAGGGLTILGSWIASTQAAKRAAQQASLLREREAVESAREIVFELYVYGRDRHEGGERNRIDFDKVALLDAEARVYLVPDETLREVLIGALGALRGLGAAIENGTLTGNPAKLQVQVLFASLQVLSAIARGDEIPARQVANLRRIGEATRDAWQELIRKGEATEI